uniref:Peptidase A1 domain-containing protein n=1 Tax=Pectinophora gossypiella TaxID=13191 RepID=A0A1E1WAL9_PECGO
MTMSGICVSFAIFLFVFLSKCYGEEYNLSGEAGQAYAIEINVGHPHQKLSVLVDTGSTTLAIASYARQDSDIYFQSKNSSSIYDSAKEVQAKYSQGMWVGRLVTDFIQFPSLPSVPEVRSDIALITKSHKFFMNGSGWQGLLGLAYLPVGAWGENVIVESWLDSLDRMLNKPMSFKLKLCGAHSAYNATHIGSFKMLEDDPKTNPSTMFRTTILRKRWYEVGVISIRLIPNNASNTITNNTTFKQVTTDSDAKGGFSEVNQETCTKLNDEKSIVDSGTTNIRLPDLLFRQVVDELRNAAQASNVLILDEVWYHGEVCNL